MYLEYFIFHVFLFGLQDLWDQPGENDALTMIMCPPGRGMVRGSGVKGGCCTGLITNVKIMLNNHSYHKGGNSFAMYHRHFVKCLRNYIQHPSSFISHLPHVSIPSIPSRMIPQRGEVSKSNSSSQMQSMCIVLRYGEEK